jgi:hypothetical protein
MLRSIGQEGIAALTALGRELCAWKGTRKRALINAQAVLSVALAVLLARVSSRVRMVGGHKRFRHRAGKFAPMRRSRDCDRSDALVAGLWPPAE